jgi:ABC-type glycerol-3-phosphate transport system permease component
MLGMSVLVAGGGTIATVITELLRRLGRRQIQIPGPRHHLRRRHLLAHRPDRWSLPSQIQLMQALHLDGTVIGCIFLYSGGFGTNFLLLYSFFKNLSWTYVEAAKIDGASDFRIFLQIVLPMAKGPMVAVTILTFIGLWNDYLTPIHLS